VQQSISFVVLIGCVVFSFRIAVVIKTETMSEEVKTPWKNGTYISDANSSQLLRVNGTQVDMFPPTSLDFPDMESMGGGTWSFGDFGPAHEEVQKITGIKNNNVDSVLWHGMLKSKGVLTEDGTKVVSWGMWNCIETFTWQSDEDLEKLAEDRDPVEAPSCHYKIQPENQGKLVWLSGPPGAGKSTTGQMMGKESGYVYYEADCTMQGLNPFVPLDSENPTLAAFRQKPLKGITKEAIDDVRFVEKEMQKMTTGNFDDIDWSKAKPFLKNMAKDILVQKNRIGGDFAVAHAVMSREMRDHIRDVLPDCIFITLAMTNETQKERIKERHGDSDEAEMVLEVLTKIHSRYEGPGDGEKNTYNVDIGENMTRKDVLDKVLEVLKENC